MIISLVIANGISQIMLTPETDAEKAILKLIGESDALAVVKKYGHFVDGGLPTYTWGPAGEKTEMCQGGYLRNFQSKESVMLVITSPEPTTQPSERNA